jgi:hypothetical protein
LTVYSALPMSLDELRGAGLPTPGDLVSAFVSGSIVAGWGHHNSDVDLFVVTDAAADLDGGGLRVTRLTESAAPIVTHYVGERRWDVEYWLARQVEQLLAGVEKIDLQGMDGHADLVSDEEVKFLYQLSIARAIAGEDWLRDIQQRLAASPLRLALAARAFNRADNAIDDAAGMIRSGDDRSAILAAQMAYGLAVDGYLAANGEICPTHKWRARKVAQAKLDGLDPDAYWALETMRDLDPDQPGRWVELVLEECRRLMLEVDFA